MRCKVTNQLAECLAAKEMKKSQLAHRLRMSRAYVTRLVDGDIRPSLEAAIRIARFFRKPVEDIFQLEESAAAAQAAPETHFPGVPPSAPGEQRITAEKPKSK
jgi:putative transcriptional regulator